MRLLVALAVVWALCMAAALALASQPAASDRGTVVYR